MPQSNLATWLQFAIQQMAAESYLDDMAQLANRLKLGNNNIPNADPNTPILPGNTRLVGGRKRCQEPLFALSA
jgi:hypothetical protein